MVVPAGGVDAEKVILTSLLVLVAVAEEGVGGGGNGINTESDSLAVGLVPPLFLEKILYLYVEPRVSPP
jgi:hypothetical protein